MSWLRIDDQIAFHAKVVVAGNEALGAWLRGAAWSSAHGTGGVVPDVIAKTIARGAVWKKLESAKPPGHQHGLVERIDGAWKIHDFEHYSRAFSGDPQLSEKRREAGRKGAEARWQSSQDGDANNMAKPIANGYQNDASRARSRPVPSRPDPILPSVGSEDEPPDNDPWGLSPGRDPDNLETLSPSTATPPPARPATSTRPSEPPKPLGRSRAKGVAAPDLEDRELPGAARTAARAILEDETLAPIVSRPNRLAKDLVESNPAVNVAGEVRRAGAWLRANPTKAKKNGNAFLLGWCRRTQESGGSRGYTSPEQPAPPPTSSAPPVDAPERPPVRPAIAAAMARASEGSPEKFTAGLFSSMRLEEPK